VQNKNTCRRDKKSLIYCAVNNNQFEGSSDMFKHKKQLPLLLAALALPSQAWAGVDSGDTSWMLISTALVLFMTPGLAFFYAGMVRSKNAASTLYQNVIVMAVVGVLWAVVGYSLAFGAGNSFIGDFSYAMLKGVGQEPVDANATIPHILFMAFQMMFAIITPALITGAFAERVNFIAWLAIMILWSLLVYSPVAHWVWSPNGWLFKEGAFDFAGGFVVHMTSGYSALIAAIMFGKRRDFGQHMPPHNVAMIVLGTAILWFGWFGFNAGSALTSSGLASQAFINTFFGAATAMLAWTLVDMIKDGKPSVVGGCVGLVAGLVAITPASGGVTAGSALIIGVVTGLICNLGSRAVKKRFSIDDTLDVFGCHGIGGTIGAVMTGLLSTSTVNPAAPDGLFYGGTNVFSANLIAGASIALYSMVITYVIIKLVNMIIPVRVSAQDEDHGLDRSQHGEAINTFL
jgi:ammonium transporter, Amt family